MAGTAIVTTVEKYMVNGFETKAASGVCFHTPEHTRSIIKAVKKIGASCDLSKKELILLQIASWFLPAPELAVSFLAEQHVAEPMINRVTALLTAAAGGHQPACKLEEIMLDAAHCYFAKKSFPESSRLLWKETELLNQTIITKEAWNKEMIARMEGHEYFTAYGHASLAKKKKLNLEKLKAQLPKTGTGPDKGIETLFKIACSNNQRFFTVADNKAHILITVNAIIMSIIVSFLIRKLAEESFLTWPTFMLLGTTFISTVYAILATRPRVSRGTFSADELAAKQLNLIHFGNFRHMTVEEYIAGIELVMTDRVVIYQTLMRDVYWHGTVLNQKYGFLRKAYNVFLFGLIISIAAFVIAFVLHNGFN